MSSTAEMIFHFAESTNLLQYIDTDIATCLYTGILTDTHSFCNSASTSLTHQVASKLIEKGIDHSRIYENIYNCINVSRLKLLGKMLSNMIVSVENSSICFFLTQSDADEAGYCPGDTVNFVEYGLTMKGINFSCFFFERKIEEKILVCLYSRGSFKVDGIAREYFNGGGHPNDAGGDLPSCDMSKAISLFHSIVEKYKNDIIHSY